jgi:hypothetical protein
LSINPRITILERPLDLERAEYLTLRELSKDSL